MPACAGRITPQRTKHSMRRAASSPLKTLLKNAHYAVGAPVRAGARNP